MYRRRERVHGERVEGETDHEERVARYREVIEDLAGSLRAESPDSLKGFEIPWSELDAGSSWDSQEKFATFVRRELLRRLAPIPRPYTVRVRYAGRTLRAYWARQNNRSYELFDESGSYLGTKTHLGELVPGDVVIDVGGSKLYSEYEGVPNTAGKLFEVLSFADPNLLPPRPVGRVGMARSRVRPSRFLVVRPRPANESR